MMTARDRLYLVALAAASFVSAPALAGTVKAAGKPQACSEKLMASVAYHFGMGDVVAAACKRWPGDEKFMLSAALAEGDRGREKDIVVAMVDDRTGKVISSHRGKANEEGGVTAEENSVHLDTARYELAPGVRAFGVDINYTVRVSCAEGGWGPERTLYVRDGKQLKPVLSDLPTSYWNFANGDFNPCSPPRERDPDPLVEDFDVTLAVDKTATSNGYADLLVTTVSRFENGKKSNRPAFHYRLRYDGKKYQTKDMDEAFRRWRSAPVHK